jgi:hypothetical protein
MLRWLREPLLHFVLLGATLFGAYQWLNPAGGSAMGEIVVSEDAANAVEPTDADLAEYLAKNADDYRVESQLTFTQVFLDPSKRGDQFDADAAALLDVLRTRGNKVNPATLGDSLMLESRYELATESDIARLFGRDFAAVLRDQPVGEWVNPLKSGYGAHLVRIEAGLLRED